MMAHVALFVLVCVLTGGTMAAAQAKAPAAPPPPAQDPPPAPPPNFEYEAASRRDPFVSLVNRGAETRASVRGTRPDGLAGVLVDEVVVRGILQTRDGWLAMIGSPAGRTYTVRPGDRLMDGSVRAITNQAVVLMQDVNDPLSLQKQREVRKFLREVK